MVLPVKAIWIKWPAIAKGLGSIGVLIGVLTLAATREKLLRNNMFDTQGKYSEDIACDERSKTARTEDGTCNDLVKPEIGAAYVRFGRNVAVSATHGETGERLLTPNPREISRQLMTRETFQPASSLNFLAAAWIQFETHDWFSHGENDSFNPIKVPLAADDPFQTDTLEIRRTRKDPSRTTAEDGKPLAFQNTTTHWWDGSQIYGSDKETNDRVRFFADGKLKVDAHNRLPTDYAGLPVTGFNDNWWLGLSLLHQLFVLEHNSIADMVKSKHPQWSDQKIYDVSRLINSALIAKIHTVEWTTAILDNPVLHTAMNTNWWGYFGKKGQGVTQDVIQNVTGALAPFTAILKLLTKDNPELQQILTDSASIEHALGGLVGSSRPVMNGVPYTLTEEFVSVYRMHPLLRDNIDIYSARTNQLLESIPTQDSRNGSAEAIMNDHELGDLWYSFGITNPGSLTLGNYPKFMQSLSLPLIGDMDMGTIDIIRDRERGVPRYNNFRRLVGLNPITKFEDLTSDQQTLTKLKNLYKNNIEDIDLLVGSLAETVRPDGFGFGETSFQIFILNASRRLMTDRFYTKDYTPAVYTQEGIDWVNNTTMVNVITRHFPALADKIGNETNAFKPWKPKN